MIIARGKATSCRLHPIISVVLNCAMICLNTNELVTNKIATIYKTERILQLKDLYNLEASKLIHV